MRLLALVFILLLGIFAVSAQNAYAQTGSQQSQASMDELRTGLRGALNQSRQFLGNLFTEAKNTSGLNDEQLFAVGVGLLSGLMVADVVGTAGIGQLVFAAGGGLFGKWVATPSK